MVTQAGILRERFPERSSRSLIPGGAQTLSKRPDQFPGNAPRFLRGWKAAHVWGDDFTEYVDWIAGLGAISLGYLHFPFLDAIGQTPSMPTEWEENLAEELAPLMPWPDPMFRFGLSGSDAIAGAMMCARENGRAASIENDSYHGWIHRGWRLLPVYADELISSTPLVIFDEVLTGFRYPGYTYAAYKGVTPDLIVLGKAIANGFPLSVVAGPERYMKALENIWWSGTHFGNTIGLAAALATISVFKTRPVIDHLWKVGRAVQDHWNAEAVRLGLTERAQGDPPRSVVRWSSMAAKTLVCEEMFRRGIMFTVGFTPMYAHTETDVERTMGATTAALELLAKHKDDPAAACQGPIIAPPPRAHG